jgi:hypothetical protein
MLRAHCLRQLLLTALHCHDAAPYDKHLKTVLQSEIPAQFILIQTHLCIKSYMQRQHMRRQTEQHDNPIHMMPRIAWRCIQKPTN